MLVTGSEFARMCGVSKMAISKAPPMKIVKGADGKIDTENPINAIYLAEHSGKSAPAPDKKKNQATKKRKPKPPVDNGLTEEEQAEYENAMGEDMASWTLRDKKASALLKEATERKITLGHMVRKGELIERKQFVEAVQGINKAIDDHLHRVPAKLGPIIFALARREGATELEIVRAIEIDMGAAIRRATEDVARLEP